MLTPEQVSKLAATAARRYARKCWWADPEDLTQTAELAALEALRTFDARVGTAPEQYVWRAIVLSVSRQLWQDSTPATGGTKHRPRTTASGLARSALGGPEFSDGAGEDHFFAELDAASARAGYGWSSPRPDALYEDAEWLARVQARLEDLAAAEDDAPGARGALRVLLGEATAADVAAAGAVPRAHVYGRSSALRGALGADEALYALMRERAGSG